MPKAVAQMAMMRTTRATHFALGFTRWTMRSCFADAESWRYSAGCFSSVAFSASSFSIVASAAGVRCSA